MLITYISLFIIGAIISESRASKLSRIAFGSCNTPNRPAMWPLIEEFHPDTLLLLGDNIYADREPGGMPRKVVSPLVIQDMYNRVSTDDTFRSLVSTVDLMATIDDHDYGQNNGDKNFAFKVESHVRIISITCIFPNEFIFVLIVEILLGLHECATGLQSQIAKRGLYIKSVS